MGVVYLAERQTSQGTQQVALKVIRTELAHHPEFRQRFAREARSAATVSGPYIARIVALDVDSDTQWIATEFIDGPTLDRAVSIRGPLPVPEVFALADGLAKALVSLHAKGLVHRDLKPSNVILSERGPIIIDFGIARANEATQLTQTGSSVGSPGWMAPEQITGAPESAATDVFAWGCVIAYAANGRHPWGEGRPDAITWRILNQAPNISDVPEPIKPLVRQTLVLNPDYRPATAAITEIVAAAQQSSPPIAHKVSPDPDIQPNAVSPVSFDGQTLAADASETVSPSPGVEAHTVVQGPRPMARVGSKRRSRRPLIIGAIAAVAIGVPLVMAGVLIAIKAPSASNTSLVPTAAATHASATNTPAVSTSGSKPVIPSKPNVPAGMTRLNVKLVGSAICAGGSFGAHNTTTNPIYETQATIPRSGQLTMLVPSADTRSMAFDISCDTWPFTDAVPIVVLQYEGVPAGASPALVATNSYPSPGNGSYCWAGTKESTRNIVVHGWVHDSGKQDPTLNMVTIWADPGMTSIQSTSGESWQRTYFGGLGHQDLPYC